ncbi:hypothetical protein IW146_009261, partial [Coemansia sp. RSA 922]
TFRMLRLCSCRRFPGTGPMKATQRRMTRSWIGSQRQRLRGGRETRELCLLWIPTNQTLMMRNPLRSKGLLPIVIRALPRDQREDPFSQRPS